MYVSLCYMVVIAQGYECHDFIYFFVIVLSVLENTDQVSVDSSVRVLNTLGTGYIPYTFLYVISMPHELFAVFITFFSTHSLVLFCFCLFTKILVSFTIGSHILNFFLFCVPISCYFLIICNFIIRIQRYSHFTGKLSISLGHSLRNCHIY